jgi:restriction system protein
VAGIREQLLRKLESMDDKQFEELVGRILIHLQYQDVNVVGRSGDGGIDVECWFPLPLIDMPLSVACQVKRHRNTVGPNVVGDLRGRWAHRADRLILVNLGGFTAGAKEVAAEAGAKMVTLISGNELVDLMASEGIGVRREPVVVEAIDETFFSPFSSE